MLRPSRPWRSPLQARDLRDETPWAAPPSSCLPCSLPSLPPCSHGAPRAVTATTPQSAWRQRGGRAYPPLLGGRSGNANSNAPERAQVQSDLASRRRNQAPSGDPFAPNCLKGQQFDSYWLRHDVSISRRYAFSLRDSGARDRLPAAGGRAERPTLADEAALRGPVLIANDVLVRLKVPYRHAKRKDCLPFLSRKV